MVPVILIVLAVTIMTTPGVNHIRVKPTGVLKERRKPLSFPV